MEERESLCAIPRNLNKQDTIIHYPIKLNWKQITYIGIGVVGAYVAFQTVLPLAYKVLIMTSSVGTTAIASLIKHEDSTLDELAVDSLYFAQKKNIYKQLEKRGELNVKISTYKEEEQTISRDGTNIFTFSTAAVS